MIIIQNKTKKNERTFYMSDEYISFLSDIYEILPYEQIIKKKITVCQLLMFFVFTLYVYTVHGIKIKRNKWNEKIIKENKQINYFNDVFISSIKFERKCVSVDLPSIEIPF